MPEQTWPIFAVLLGDSSTTAARGGALQGALDRKNELVSLGQVGLEHADIGDIERDRDEWLFGHGLSLSVQRAIVHDCAPNRPNAQPLHLGTSTGSPREPK